LSLLVTLGILGVYIGFIKVSGETLMI